jgi:hypothetical protein
MSLSEDVIIFKGRFNKKAFWGCFLIFLIGVGCLILSSLRGWWVGREVFQTTLLNLGGFLVGAGVLSSLWEVWWKRNFLDEILAKVEISASMKMSGVSKIYPSFYDITRSDWRSYIMNAKYLDVFVSYGRTWRNTLSDDLRELSAEVNTRIRIFMPDPDNHQLMEEISRRFKDMTPEKLKGFITETATFFSDLYKESGSQGAKIEVWYIAIPIQFSCYITENIGILAILSHRHERVSVPTLVCEQGGFMYSFIRSEVDSLTSSTHSAKQIV